MSNSRIYILHQDNHPAIPDTIKTHICGSESIIEDGGDTIIASGRSMLIEGTTEDVRNWLCSAQQVWTALNPISGDWQLMGFTKEE